MTERELLVDCLRRLNSVGLPYMLTGSMASNYWGIPRTTHDFDIVVQLPETAIKPLVLAFRGDYYIDEEAIRQAFKPPYQFNAIDTRSTLKVDFWLVQPKPYEREMFGRRLKVVLFGEKAWICTAEDVILHKLYWNGISPSDRQLGDAAGVWSVQGSDLDLDYMKDRASMLGVSSVLESILAGRIKSKST